MEVLCRHDRGLFPSNKEVTLSCSCPDGAWLCKHLAAVLYGIGARLDEAPELLFVLRGVDQLELISQASSGAALGVPTRKADLGGESLSELFGIELDPGAAQATQSPKVAAGGKQRLLAPLALEGKVKPVKRAPKSRAKPAGGAPKQKTWAKPVEAAPKRGAKVKAMEAAPRRGAKVKPVLAAKHEATVKPAAVAPKHEAKAKRVIAELKRRAARRRSLASGANRGDWLYAAAVLAFGSWGKAVQAAGFDYEAHRQRPAAARPTLKAPAPHLTPMEKVVARIREVALQGVPDLQRRDLNLLMAAQREFGSWDAALKAASSRPPARAR
jgi:hypothetical protein